MDKFQPDICEANIKRIADLLDKLDYKGPVAFLRDDTELDPSSQGFWDGEEWHLVGCTGGARLVKTADELDELLRDPTLPRAKKVSRDFHPILSYSYRLPSHSRFE